MPKPFFLARPSGLFVRFLVPIDLRARLGRRFLVRRLPPLSPARARLAAAHLGAALSEAFEQMRGEAMADFDIKGLTDKARRGELRDLTMREEIRPDGTRVRSAEISSEADLALYQRITDGTAYTFPGLAPKQVPATLAPPAPAPAPAPSANPDDEPPPLLSEAIADYKAERVGKRDARGELDVNNALRLFLELTGDLPVDKVKKRHLIHFDETLLHRPVYANNKAQFKGLNAQQITEKSKALRSAGQQVELLGDRTRGKYRDTLAAFFNWLTNNELLARAPSRGGIRQRADRIEVKQTRRAYTPDELERIFAPDTFGPWSEHKPHHYWAPWLALYSGARLNEIAQLYCDDIETIEGVPGFHVRNARPDQHIKKGGNVRFVPFAQAVLDAGLLDYVTEVKAAGHARLFPHLKYTNSDYGDYLGDRFGVYLVDIGLKAPADTPTDARQATLGMGFHWFRYCVGALVNKGMTPTEVAGITGHGGNAHMPGALPVYVNVPTLPARVKVVNEVRGPKPPTYTPGLFAAALQEAHDLPAKWAAEEAARLREKNRRKR